MSDLSASVHDSDIAIIGLACRLPGSADVQAFWRNLCAGEEGITFFSETQLQASGIAPEVRAQPNYVKAAGVLADIEWFDAHFFDFTPKEASITDPQHRLFLECAWNALESAGYATQTDAYAIGVYAGVSLNTYLLNNLAASGAMAALADQYALLIGNDKDFFATRVSYKLNLKGPSLNVQTACSTSLTAVHLACQSLLNGECDIAIAGGAAVRVPHQVGYVHQEGMIFSPDGHCRAFDAQAKGTVAGNGVGAVVLKRLADALQDGDSIQAVIKGSAVNNDGAMKIGYTAPGIAGQTAVIAEAQAVAGVAAETISYVEAHGTGTTLGDPIEMAALTKAFRFSTDKKTYCALGSVKSNIGHTDAAAGIAGLIKTVLALQHRTLPPSLHFHAANPHIDFANSPFYVNHTLTPWNSDKGAPRRAGVSAFGIGGSNAHVVLEEAPSTAVSPPAPAWTLLTLSAKTATALATASNNLAEYLQQHPESNLADVAYTLSCGRQAFQYRRMLLCAHHQAAAVALQTLDPTCVFTAQRQEQRAVAFMFPGQGAQYLNMALALYRHEAVFREQIEQCSELLKAHLGLDLREVLYPTDRQREHATQQLAQTALTQAALFVVEYALAKLWMAWGATPQAMIGHSIGEYVAACLAEVFSLADALLLVAARGRLMQQMAPGEMLAVPLAAQEVQPLLLQTPLCLAAINAPTQCVVSGPASAISALATQLAERNIAGRRLHTSHAFHSAMMDPVLAAFLEQLNNIHLHPPKIPYLSNLTGDWISAAEATSPEYWCRHLRHTVRFAQGLQRLLENPALIVLEIGPGQTLTGLARRNPSKTAQHVMLPCLPQAKAQQSDMALLHTSLGRYWLAGGPVDWPAVYAPTRRRRLPLPTYPFERQRYWIDPPAVERQGPLPVATQSTAMAAASSAAEDAAPHDVVAHRIAQIWADAFGVAHVGVQDDFFALGGDSLLAAQVMPRLNAAFNIQLTLAQAIEAPTVHLLARLIEKMRVPQPAKPAILVEIQAGDKVMPPLFCLHPAGGGVFHFVALARHLSAQQPIYGVQALPLRQHTAVTLAAKALLYIQAIQRIQATGPYFLVGMSYGGNMALEMAIQLRKQGHAVALTALFDSYPPATYEQRTQDSGFLAAFILIAQSRFGDRYPLQKYYDAAPKAVSEEAQWRYISQQIKHTEDVIGDEVRALFSLWKGHHLELQQHPSQRYPGRITFFQADEDMPVLFRAMPGLKVGRRFIVDEWQKLSSQPVEVFTVPGNHITMLDETNAPVLADKLGKAIAKASIDSYDFPAVRAAAMME